MRNLLFISHANPEDNVFSRWLALQLAKEGYGVWCDRTPLLGGEDFWPDIERAIREHTCKLLYVLSAASNHKPGPLQELHVAQTVARLEGLREFIIPLRIDNTLAHSDTNIQLARINAIDFTAGWATGLHILLKKLQQDRVQKDARFSAALVASWWQSQFGIDNQLIEAVKAYFAGKRSPGESRIALEEIFAKQILVPTYDDKRYAEGMKQLFEDQSIEGITIAELLDSGTIGVRGGHGSPGNDQRIVHIPYVKVSDIRALRINVNPTNLVTESVARRFWRGESTGLQAWDAITPNRASSNIGEFAILLPGEEQIVLTKEVFVFRVLKEDVWALSLRAVRDLWRRIALMQTNHQECSERYREIILPNPLRREWACDKSAAFRNYFRTIAEAKQKFIESIHSDNLEYIASVVSIMPIPKTEDEVVDSDETRLNLFAGI